MVEQRFPGANLIGQFLRQVTQPVSTFIVMHVKKQPFLRKHILAQLGRFCRWCEDRIMRHKASLVEKRKRICDIRTTDLGTKLLLEVLVFGFLWTAIVYETGKAAERSRIVEQQRAWELDDLKEEKDRLKRQIGDQVISTERLKEIVVKYSKQVGCTLPRDPWKVETTASSKLR